MASTTETTFGAKVANAETLLTNMGTFANYSPVRPEDSIANFKTFIKDLKLNNKSVATNQTIYSNAVDKRVKLFADDANSLSKTLSPIVSQVKARFGNTSKEAKDIATLIKKIRGEKTTKLKKDADGEFVSQSERSYGSQAQTFADIISTLTQYGADYAPANTKIKVANLETQQTKLIDANTAVTTSFSNLKPVKDLRQKQYDELKDRADRIKQAVKSQYGLTSSEYKLIKGLKI
jgi:hypothetical protein